MELADLGWGQRVKIPAAKVVIVGTDDDVFVGLAGKIGKHVVHRGLSVFDINLQRNAKAVRKSERAGLRRTVNLVLDLGQRFPSCLKPAFSNRVPNLQ